MVADYAGDAQDVVHGARVLADFAAGVHGVDKEDGEREGACTLKHFVDHDAIREGAGDSDECPEAWSGQHETAPVRTDMGEGDDVSPEGNGFGSVRIAVWVVCTSQCIGVNPLMCHPDTA